MEGAGDEFASAVGRIDFLDPLGHLAEHAAEVDLLERLAPTHGAADLADEDDHRGRILAADVNAGRSVGGAGAARHHDDAGAAGELAPGLRRHGGAAFLAAERHCDRRIVERIEQRQIALAGHAEDALDAVILQRLDDQPRRRRRVACAVRHSPPLQPSIPWAQHIAGPRWIGIQFAAGRLSPGCAKTIGHLRPGSSRGNRINSRMCVITAGGDVVVCRTKPSGRKSTFIHGGQGLAMI